MILRSTCQDKCLVKYVRAFFTAIYDVQVSGYVWTGKNDVMRLRVDAESFKNGKKRVDGASGATLAEVMLWIW